MTGCSLDAPRNPIVKNVVVNRRNGRVPFKNVDALLLSSHHVDSGRDREDKLPAIDFGGAYGIRNNYFFNVFGIKSVCTAKNKNETKNPLHKFDLDEDFIIDDERINDEDFCFDAFPNPAEDSFMFLSRPVHLGEARVVLDQPNRHMPIVMLTKEVMLRLAGRDRCDLEEFLNVVSAEDMRVLSSHMRNMTEILNYAFTSQSASSLLCAFDLGANWRTTLYDMPLFQHFLGLIVCPYDWRQLFWACYGFICCISSGLVFKMVYEGKPIPQYIYEYGQVIGNAEKRRNYSTTIENIFKYLKKF